MRYITRRKNLLMLILTVLAGAAVAGSYGMKMFNNQKTRFITQQRLFSAQGGHYIHLQKDIIGKDHHSLWIEEDGVVTYTHYQNAVREDRRGRISVNKLDALYQFLRAKDIFALQDRYPLATQPNVLYESVSYELVVSFDDQTKTLSADEHAMPQVLRDIAKRLLATAKEVPDSRLYGTFIAARTMAEKYYIQGRPWKTESELIKEKGVRFHIFTEKSLKEYSELGEALLRPRKFIHLDEKDVSQLKDLSQGGESIYITFENQDFEVSFYTRKEGG